VKPEPPSVQRNDRLQNVVSRAVNRLLGDQSESGFWCYEFEADCTIPAEYVLMAHFTGDPQFTSELAPDLEPRIAAYLRRRQLADGGWPLFAGGEPDLSCSVKVYFALKLMGDPVDAPHMVRARNAILARGGAVRVNVFTRIALALFEQLPWAAVPFVPVELVLLPRWLPAHLYKVAYWSRAVTVPLSILCSLRARAVNPTGCGVAELFVRPPEQERRYFVAQSLLNRLFIVGDQLGRRLEGLIPRRLRALALRRAEAWLVERLNGVDGLGAIFPAMVNAYEALGELGYDPGHPTRRSAAEALKRLVVLHAEEAYCQPCLSPIWDTGLGCLALFEAMNAGYEGAEGPVPDRSAVSESLDRCLERHAALAPVAPAPMASALRAVGVEPMSRSVNARAHEGAAPLAEAICRALDWTAARQIRDAHGDWRIRVPELPGGGWPFEFGNDHYPDIDDTALVGWIMQRFDPVRYRKPISRAAHWVSGMQSSNGGFASFDKDNTAYYLNEIPFADHGALLDPPTSDVTARCLAFLALVDREHFGAAIDRALEFLLHEQEPEGSWFGRWGTNYIYGTWSVLCALELLGPERLPEQGRAAISRAGAWLESCQRPDGGWGETNESYTERALMGTAERSTAFHTAWAILGLMTCGLHMMPAVARGADYLCRTQLPSGHWHDEAFTCPGFPRVFYLKYHGYSKYFPAWALARFTEWSRRR